MSLPKDAGKVGKQISMPGPSDLQSRALTTAPRYTAAIRLELRWYLDAVVSVVEELAPSDRIQNRVGLVIDNVVCAHGWQVYTLREEMG